MPSSDQNFAEDRFRFLSKRQLSHTDYWRMDGEHAMVLFCRSPDSRYVVHLEISINESLQTNSRCFENYVDFLWQGKNTQNHIFNDNIQIFSNESFDISDDIYFDEISEGTIKECLRSCYEFAVTSSKYQNLMYNTFLEEIGREPKPLFKFKRTGYDLFAMKINYNTWTTERSDGNNVFYETPSVKALHILL